VVQWTKSHRQYGVEALAAKRRGRRAGEAGKLNGTQAKRMRTLVVGKLPDQLKLPFYLWTRAAVQRLIERECKVRLSLSAVGGYLARWGLSAQRPIKRAYERNDEAIAQWLAEVYPSIEARAKRHRPRSTGAMKLDFALTMCAVAASLLRGSPRWCACRASALAAT
jgi:transposase